MSAPQPPAEAQCWCIACRPQTLDDMRFVVCPDCGNKRCPRANDHRHACTNSNEPGQPGSAYPAAEAQSQGGGEVVAWRWPSPKRDWVYSGAGSKSIPPTGAQPLYTAPPSAPVGGEGFDKRFAEMLLGILNDVQDELGFTDEDKLCANGSAEIVAEIRGLKHVAALAQQPAAVDGADTRRLDWLDGRAHCADWDTGGREVMRRVIRADDGEEFCADTWREAIDMALAAQPGGGHG